MTSLRPLVASSPETSRQRNTPVVKKPPRSRVAEDERAASEGEDDTEAEVGDEGWGDDEDDVELIDSEGGDEGCGDDEVEVGNKGLGTGRKGP
jgi:hypothetical protein